MTLYDLVSGPEFHIFEKLKERVKHESAIENENSLHKP